MQLSPKKQPKEDHKKSNGENTPSNNVQEDWEDISDDEGASQPEAVTSGTNGSVSGSTVSVRKKRRGQTKTTVASSTPKAQPAKARKKPPALQKEELREALAHGTRYTATYAFDVFKGAVERMRRPLSWFLFVYMLAWLVSRMTPTIRTALSPLCILPGMSRSTLCVPVKPAPSVNFEKLANIQGSTFEQLAGEAAGGSDLSIGVLRAEMATRDLSLVVRYSDLRSKEGIADSLETVASDAKRTGRGLGKLNAKVVGAIDEVMALNNYAMATIGDAHKKAPSRVLQAIAPFKLGPTAEEIIAETFTLAMDESERTIGKLKIEAEVSWQNLEQLDADIATLHEIVTREDKHTTAERDELLGELWTRWAGGNKKAIRDQDDRLALLNDLGEYRKQAAAHVKAAMRALYTMSDDLEVLRERVAAPGLLDGKVPLHVHMESIQNGLERLQEGRAAARGRSMDHADTVRVILNSGSG